MSSPDEADAKSEPSQQRGRARRPLRERRPSPIRTAKAGGAARFGRPGTDFGDARRRGPSPARAGASASGAVTYKLQKRLAEAGLGSRRAMEELIQAGEVRVNGRVAQLGARVGAGDAISVRGTPLMQRPAERRAREPRIVLYHKPEGQIVSRRDPEGRPSVFDHVPIVQRGRWLAVGRLDFNTCGLLVFTDSGELANRLTHPRYQQVRDYAVRIVGELSDEQMARLRRGIALDDGPARFELLEPQGGEGTNRWYRVRVREGRNRLVRRMFAALGVTVSRLMRTRFGPFELPPRLKRGQWLRMEPAEVKEVLKRLEAESGRDRTRRAEREAPVRRAPGQREGLPGPAAKPHRPPRRYRSS
jgi:23S rRNA pseudouridine2605 synthase